MHSRAAHVRYVRGTLSLSLALIIAMFAFSHFAIGEPWSEHGACYAHPLLAQTCHPAIEPSQLTYTFTTVKRQ